MTQLDALARVAAQFDEANIDYWLFGGWAVDFHVGRVTREHDDVDLAVWLDDAPRIATLLEGDGWRHAPEDDEDGGAGYERDGVRVEVTYLERDGDGRLVTPLRVGTIVWPATALGDDVRELEGVRARVVSLDLLTDWKSSARDDSADAAKDRADCDALRRWSNEGGRPS